MSTEWVGPHLGEKTPKMNTNSVSERYLMSTGSYKDGSWWTHVIDSLTDKEGIGTGPTLRVATERACADLNGDPEPLHLVLVTN